MQITSPAFGHNQPLPSKYTCDGQDLSPPLEWSNAPSGTRSFVLILDDPDAPSGDFVHWTIFDIPSEVNRIAEGQAPSGMIGKNTLGTNAYVSPCPPNGQHHYVFRLYALDTMLGLDKNAKKIDLLAAMQGHILEQSELVGLYRR